MSLYIRDKAVDELAKQVQSAIDAPTKTDAVRIALQNELERARRAVPLRDRIRMRQEALRHLGGDVQDFDMKDFMDKGWGDA